MQWQIKRSVFAVSFQRICRLCSAYMRMLIQQNVSH